MRHLLATLLLLGACSSESSAGGEGGASHTPDLCELDDDCGMNEKCFHELAGAYCTETCMADADCAPKYDCEAQQEQTDSDCKDLGTLPDGSGFCERFDHLELCLAEAG